MTPFRDHAYEALDEGTGFSFIETGALKGPRRDVAAQGHAFDEFRISAWGEATQANELQAQRQKKK
jgi:hypothetical protein